MTARKIAIIGHGFVGKAVDYGFSNPNIKKIIIDPLLDTKIESLIGEPLKATFVCLPTPMAEDGSIDSSLVETAVTYLKRNVVGIIVVKSTITPDIIDRLTSGAAGHRVVYNPEFLTEKTANHDFANPTMHIFGGDYSLTKKVERLYEKYSICKPCQNFHMPAKDASFVKYAINSYLATKVTWFNQFYDVVNANDGNFNTIINAVTADARVGTSHTAVPGYDGKRGFGGSCFPKDTSAFLAFDPSFTLLRESVVINDAIRSVYEQDDREKQMSRSLKKDPLQKTNNQV